VVTPLHLTEATRRELRRRLALVYLGRSHSSSAVHEKVINRLGASAPQLEALRTAAERARDAVLVGDLHALGLAMRLNTDAQAALHADLIHPDAWRVIEIAAAHGAIGWKVNGAGGDGGSITLLCDARAAARRATIRAITQENPAWVPIPHVISRDGLRVSVHE
jgi:D-glycero-alpha-D-manno-heptose-7-phosphate kinase